MKESIHQYMLDITIVGGTEITTRTKKSRSKQAKKRTISNAGPGSRANEWRTHKDKTLDAVEESTDIMMATFLDKIRKASSEESARRSYVTGMTDMLTVARKALGFWGAEQVRMELERWNAAREPDDCDDDTEEICVHIETNGLTQEQLAKDTEGLQEHITKWIAEKRRTEQKQVRDPMFA